MQAVRTLFAAAAVLTLTLGTSRTAPAQALPSAAAVLARHATAVGGTDAVMKITSLKQVASLQLPAMGITADIEMYMAAPNKLASKTSIPGLGEMLQGTNGDIGWDANPMQGPRLLADKELAQTKEGADFYGNMLYPADRYSTLENLGIVDFNGEQAYKLKLVRKDSGREATQYFSVASGLAIGSETTQESQMGSMPVSAVFTDYKEFGGVKFATKSQMTAGPNTIITVITDIVVNNVPATAFDVPESVKPLIKK